MTEIFGNIYALSVVTALFAGAKQKNLTPENIALGAVGDVYLWVAIDAESK